MPADAPETPTAGEGSRPDRDREDLLRPWVYRTIRVVVTPLVRGVFRLQARGAENVPESGGVVLASMHRSNFDALVLGLPLRRPIRFMAKSELYGIPGFRWLLHRGGAFKVERGKADSLAIDTAERLVREGSIVVIFPEGTRNRKGTARPRGGAARIALATGAPLVPVAVRGTDRVRLFPPRVPRFGVSYGPPLELADLVDLDGREAARIATERWVTAVAALRAGLDG